MNIWNIPNSKQTPIQYTCHMHKSGKIIITMNKCISLKIHLRPWEDEFTCSSRWVVFLSTFCKIWCLHFNIKMVMQPSRIIDYPQEKYYILCIVLFCMNNRLHKGIYMWKLRHVQKIKVLFQGMIMLKLIACGKPFEYNMHFNHYYSQPC